jgi:hypothetical protein
MCLEASDLKPLSEYYPPCANIQTTLCVYHLAKFFLSKYVERNYNFAFNIPGAKLVPPAPIASTIRSTTPSNQILPSSLLNHLPPSTISSPAASKLPSSYAFLNPNT